MLNHDHIGTEHILLGLLGDEESAAGKTLQALDISLDGARKQVEEIIGQGAVPAAGHIPFTPRAKKVLDLSLREALQLGHNYIGTEHLLLGLVREGEKESEASVAATVLGNLGVTLTAVRQQVIFILSGYKGSALRKPTTPNQEFLDNLKAAGVPVDKPMPNRDWVGAKVTTTPTPVTAYEIYLIEGPHIDGPCYVAMSKPKGKRAGVADNPVDALCNLIRSQEEGRS